MSVSPALLDIQVTPHKQHRDTLCFHCWSLDFSRHRLNLGKNISHLHLPNSTPLLVVNECLFAKYFMNIMIHMKCPGCICHRYHPITARHQPRGDRFFNFHVFLTTKALLSQNGKSLTEPSSTRKGFVVPPFLFPV